MQEEQFWKEKSNVVINQSGCDFKVTFDGIETRFKIKTNGGLYTFERKF
jgi:hypothetical protein